MRMQDIEKRNVNCIIVKDLSRFGRNYIETGRYLERIFPFMGVRFIAINDHYDSAEENDDKGRILIPFNNLINDTYCRDISLRVRSHLDVKRKEGQFIGSFAGYGYRKDPKDKNHLIIDEYAAGIVQEIFKQKLNGMSSQRIASHLNELGVLPPNEYKRANGFNYTCGFQAGLNQKWTVVSVNRILKNESYTGTLIQGKRRKINYKVKKSHDVGSENWIRVEDAHDAIISKGEFQQVQQLLELDTRTAPSQTTVYPLSGFLRCADCGQNMIRRTVTKNGKKYQYYHCSTYKNGGGCTPHMINSEKLTESVLAAIRHQVTLLVEAEKVLSNAELASGEQIGIIIMSAFDNATLMITGGTGSFGSTVLKHFLDSDLKEIRIFSRDEKKQDDMRHELQAKHPEAAKKVKFYIGDVRNPQSIKDAMPGVDYIFHAAALKQVPSCEFFPMQAVQTNIIGTDNVLHAAIDAGVKRVVCLSTDKAAYPINAMGISKAMMEHVIYANARVAAERGGTTICCTRYGNVMCSRGSVIPLFIDQIKAGNPITITDPNMTRFLMNLDEAVDLVMFAFQHANPGDLFIQKSDASTIGDLAKAVQKLFGDTGTNIIGTRHGEKLFETLMTREERLRSEDMGHYFRVAADNRDLNYDKFVVKGEVHTMADESYTSHNTNRLDVEGTVKKILTTEYVQNALKGIPNV